MGRDATFATGIAYINNGKRLRFAHPFVTKRRTCLRWANVDEAGRAWPVGPVAYAHPSTEPRRVRERQNNAMGKVGNAALGVGVQPGTVARVRCLRDGPGAIRGDSEQANHNHAARPLAARGTLHLDRVPPGVCGAIWPARAYHRWPTRGGQYTRRMTARTGSRVAAFSDADTEKRKRVSGY